MPLQQEIVKKRKCAEEEIDDLSTTTSIQNQMPEMSTPQVTPPVTSVEYFPTKVKQLKTDAPTNKEQHAQEKRLKKEQRKLLKEKRKQVQS